MRKRKNMPGYERVKDSRGRWYWAKKSNLLDDEKVKQAIENDKDDMRSVVSEVMTPQKDEGGSLTYTMKIEPEDFSHVTIKDFGNIAYGRNNEPYWDEEPIMRIEDSREFTMEVLEAEGVDTYDLDDEFMDSLVDIVGNDSNWHFNAIDGADGEQWGGFVFTKRFEDVEKMAKRREGGEKAYMKHMTQKELQKISQLVPVTLYSMDVKSMDSIDYYSGEVAYDNGDYDPRVMYVDEPYMKIDDIDMFIDEFYESKDIDPNKIDPEFTKKLKDIFYYGSWEPDIEESYGEEIFFGFRFNRSNEVNELINTYNPSVRDM